MLHPRAGCTRLASASSTNNSGGIPHLTSPSPIPPIFLSTHYSTHNDVLPMHTDAVALRSRRREAEATLPAAMSPLNRFAYAFAPCGADQRYKE